MKKWFALLLVAVLALCSLSPALAEGNNPVVEGEDPFTGLPDNGVPYTPILEVLDNNTEGYPHWGVGSASILFQIPNQSAHQTKLAALFSVEFPGLAGGSRSARMTALALANAFDAAFTSANFGPPAGADVDNAVNVNSWLSTWGYRSSGKWFDLLGSNGYGERVKTAGVPKDANLQAHISMIHDELVEKGVTFEKRPFLFTDDPLERGDSATKIDVWYYDETGKGPYKASSCTFNYEDGSYTRAYGVNKKGYTGIEMDRETQEVLKFSNVIVLRSGLKWASGYTYFAKNLVGGGEAEIFQSGRHISGFWNRDSVTSRLIILDDQGQELRFLRGKSFIVIGSDKASRMAVNYTAE